MRGKRNKSAGIIVAVTIFVTPPIGPGVFTRAGPPDPRAGTHRFPSPAETRVEAELAAELGGRYRIDRSEHFILAHRLDDDRLRRVLGWMETTFQRAEHFCTENGLPMAPLDRRMVTVCVSGPLDSVNGQATRPPAGNARRSATDEPPPVLSGFYDQVLKRAYFDAAWFAPDPGNLPQRGIFEEAARVTVQHETAHQVFNHICPAFSNALPDWLAEGLACAFEIDPEFGITGYKQPNRWRLEDAVRRLAAAQVTRAPRRGNSHNAESNANALTSDTGPSPRIVPRVLRGDGSADPPARGRPVDAGAVTPTESPSWYAVSWAIVHYLQTAEPDAFRRYVQRLASRPASQDRAAQTALFEEAFGSIDAGWDDRVRTALPRTATDH